MQNLDQLELNELLELLVQHTQDHSRLIANGATVERFRESENSLILIQKEIEQRKLAGRADTE
jgi:hypothetical protein